MTGLPRRVVLWRDVVILLATIALAVTTVRWADREHLRVEPPAKAQRRRTVPRPDWVRALEYPYRRLQHDWFWLCVAATLGVGGILASDGRTWSRRGLSRPGTTVVLVVLLVGGVTAAQQTLTEPGSARPYGLSYSLRNALGFRLPGAILGVWVVAWLRPRRGSPGWRERTARIVGWIWITDVGLLIGYGLVFG